MEWLVKLIEAGIARVDISTHPNCTCDNANPDCDLPNTYKVVMVDQDFNEVWVDWVSSEDAGNALLDHNIKKYK